MNPPDADSPPILSVGTQVVTRVAVRDADGRELRPAGGVGAIMHAPMDREHRYRIRFADGESMTFRRHEIEVLSHHQEGALGAGSGGDLREHVIYRCIVGSRAFGLDDEGSDVDVRGIFLPPAHQHWSLTGVPEVLESPDADECYWELQRFLVLALKANPNILECLFTPLVEHCDPIARELLDLRRCFLSRFIHKTYNGYVLSQFRKLEKTREGGGAIKWKHAMHLIRLLLSAEAALKTGELRLDVGEHRPRLLAIKRGEMAWDEVEAWRLDLQRRFDAAIGRSPLPERPDYERVNAFLIEARRSRVNPR
ncbi:MAG: nucleotidyltransferase domain-containing protein [Planctomycetota bacterium]